MGRRLMSKQFKPMLAGKAPEDLASLDFPLYASPKIDGVRAIIRGHKVLSRSLKPIPNMFVWEQLGFRNYEGLDGELVVGPPTGMDLMQRTMSGIMSIEGKPDFTFYVFDVVSSNSGLDFAARQRLLDVVRRGPRVEILQQVLIRDVAQLMEAEQTALDAGYEGLILRHPRGSYKFGRSTTKEQWMLKLKRWEDSEAEVIGFEEKMHNANAAKTNAVGRTERSTHKAGMVPAGTLGNLLCRDVKTGQPVSIGSGLTDAIRATVWHNPAKYLGKLVTYKHFAVTGVKDAPRFPIFKAFRDRRDT